MNRIALAILAATVATWACGRTGPGELPFGDMPDFEWEGKRIRVGTTAGYLPCAGDLEFADNAVSKLEQMLDETIPENKFINVYYLPTDAREF